MDYFSDSEQKKHIVVISPYSGQEVLDIFKTVEQYKETGTDGKVLNVMLQTAYFGALKKGELLALRIKDVFDVGGKPSEQITVNNDQIKVPDELRLALKKYLNHLNSLPKYKTGLLSPLFPDPRIGTSYNDRKFNRHIRKLCREHRNISIIRIEKLRQAGICSYYESLKESGNTPDECLQKTVLFARCSEKQAIGILTDRIQPSGQQRTRPAWDE